MATAGVAPRIMGFGPSPASKKVLAQVGLTIEHMDAIELNETFAAQGLAVTRDLGLADDAAHVNPNGGAIAIGHPLGASGARLVTTALNQLERTSRDVRAQVGRPFADRVVIGRRPGQPAELVSGGPPPYRTWVRWLCCRRR